MVVNVLCLYDRFQETIYILSLCQMQFFICDTQVLDEVDRTVEEVKHEWLDCLERVVYEKRGWPKPLTAARYCVL